MLVFSHQYSSSEMVPCASGLKDFSGSKLVFWTVGQQHCVVRSAPHFSGRLKFMNIEKPSVLRMNLLKKLWRTPMIENLMQHWDVMIVILPSSSGVWSCLSSCDGSVWCCTERRPAGEHRRFRCQRVPASPTHSRPAEDTPDTRQRSNEWTNQIFCSPTLIYLTQKISNILFVFKIYVSVCIY